MIPAVEKFKLLNEKNVFDHLNSEKKYETECKLNQLLLFLAAQDFIKYSSDWWDDYKNIRLSHGTRIVKLFVPTDDREN